MAENKDTVTRVLDSVVLADFIAHDDNKAIAGEFKDAQEVKDDSGRVISLVGKNLRADITTVKTKVEDKSYDAEYVLVSARTIEGAALLTNGNVDETFKKSDDDKEREAPSVVKYFNQGFGVLARNATAARIKVKVEGPDKALLAAAKDLAKAKGWSVEKALERIKSLND